LENVFEPPFGATYGTMFIIGSLESA